jgi:hypothetical protein
VPDYPETIGIIMIISEPIQFACKISLQAFISFPHTTERKPATLLEYEALTDEGCRKTTQHFNLLRKYCQYQIGASVIVPHQRSHD